MVGVEPRRLSEAVGGAGRRLGQARLAREQLGGGARVARRLAQARLRPQRRQQASRPPRAPARNPRRRRADHRWRGARSPAPTSSTARVAASGADAASCRRATIASAQSPARVACRSSTASASSVACVSTTRRKRGSVSGSASFGLRGRARARRGRRAQQHRAGRGVAAGRRQLLQRLRAVAIAPQLRRQRHRRVQHRPVAGRSLQRRPHRPPGGLGIDEPPGEIERPPHIRRALAFDQTRELGGRLLGAPPHQLVKTLKRDPDRAPRPNGARRSSRRPRARWRPAPRACRPAAIRRSPPAAGRPPPCRSDRPAPGQAAQRLGQRVARARCAPSRRACSAMAATFAGSSDSARDVAASASSTRPRRSA